MHGTKAATLTAKDGHGYVGHVGLTASSGVGGRSPRDAMAKCMYSVDG